jgi:nucleoside-diphosphate-sugar epimerase
VRLLVFGFGYSARALAARAPRGPNIIATVRSPLPERWRSTVETVSVQDGDALATALRRADALLVTAAPDPESGLCPGFEALAPHLAPGSGPSWIGYLSTTGVYGDRGGRWVRETSELRPASETSRRRVAAEAAWAGTGRPLAVFRLPGIYGPSRSALDRVREGTARRMAVPGQVFSRIHVDDLADGLAAALAQPDRTGVFNLCDDEPAPAADVTLEACRLLGTEPPPQTPLDLQALTPAARRFWAESKRVSNARAKAALGWRPAHPTYREGLAAILASGG